MAKRYLWQWAYVPGLLILMVFARLFLDGDAPPWLLKWVTLASKYAFPVYAIHFTMLYFVQSFIPNYVPHHDHIDPYIMLITAMALSVLFGYGCFRWIKPVTDVWANRIFG